MATPVFEEMELPDSEGEGQLSEGEQEAGEPAEEGSSPAAAGAAATHAAAAGSTEEQAGSRPASRGTEASDETGSETDFTALHHEAAAAKAGKPARQGEAPPPPALTEAALAGSPWVDLEHPVTLYEGTKLALMAPVVLLKVSSGWHGWEACGMGRRLVGWHWTEGMLLSHACLATCNLHVFGALQTVCLPHCLHLLPSFAEQLLVLAVAVPYAWAVLALLLLGHKPQTAMAPFRCGQGQGARLLGNGGTVAEGCIASLRVNDVGWRWDAELGLPPVLRCTGFQLFTRPGFFPSLLPRSPLLHPTPAGRSSCSNGFTNGDDSCSLWLASTGSRFAAGPTCVPPRLSGEQHGQPAGWPSFVGQGCTLLWPRVLATVLCKRLHRKR